tara:strand:+ start:389 stop:784 length:396 start_codon:yes stop_codon:yes gene_type:complete
MYSCIKHEIVRDNTVELYDLVAKEECSVVLKEICFNDDNIQIINFKEKTITLKKNQSLCLRGYHQNIVVLDDYPSMYYYNNSYRNIIMNYGYITDNYIQIKNKNRKLDINYYVKIYHDKDKCFISETLVKS